MNNCGECRSWAGGPGLDKKAGHSDHTRQQSSSMVSASIFTSRILFSVPALASLVHGL